jgi:hypothetical protein
VVFSITREDLQTLDKREGVREWPPKYHREPVEILRTDRRVLEAWTYFAVTDDTPAREYLPSRAYMELYIKGAEHFNLPREYVGQLRQIETDEQKF